MGKAQWDFKCFGYIDLPLTFSTDYFTFCFSEIVKPLYFLKEDMPLLSRDKSTLRFNNLKDNEGRMKQHSMSFMARREPRVLTLGQS
ncbi:hypothetical protein TNCV_1716481 [Trichonephila clavipes]|nr:hypothetical protein TNCV_1716481 [Trichonephila clavipes]